MTQDNKKKKKFEPAPKFLVLDKRQWPIWCWTSRDGAGMTN